MQTKNKRKSSQETVHEYNQNQSNQIQVFENAEFGEIRTLMIDDEPWFVGKDVAVILGYTDLKHAILDHVDVEDRINSKTQGHFDPEFGQRGTWLINESGLYSLILSSKLPSAKEFKHWVTAEILPSLRKHGAYMTPETIEKVLYNPDFLIKIANTLKAEQEKNRKLLAQKQELQTENQELKTTNKALLGEIQNWDYKPLITKLIRVYSSRAANGIFGIGWNRYYDELLYKYSINLKTRKTKSKTSKSCLDFISQDEVEIAVKVAVAMCESSGIKTNDILNRYR